MKRPTLIGRAEFLFEKQEEVAKAAREFAKHENASMSMIWQREQARRALYQASLALGVAMKRYLGGG